MIKTPWILEEANKMFPELEWKLSQLDPREKSNNFAFANVDLVPGKISIKIYYTFEIPYSKIDVIWKTKHEQAPMVIKQLKHSPDPWISLELINNTGVSILTLDRDKEHKTRDEVYKTLREFKQQLLDVRKNINEMFDTIQKNEIFK